MKFCIYEAWIQYDIYYIFKQIAIQVLYKHFREGGVSETMLILLIYGGGGPEFGETCLYDTCMLPNDKTYHNVIFWKASPKQVKTV